MDRQDILKRLLYPKCKTAIEFQFDNLIVNPMLSYITMQDIAQLHKIATSLKYSSKPKEKYAMIDSIMTNRGFKKMASGTNRVTYRCLNDYRVVIKIAIDKVGLSDNGNEYRNQQLLKPFVTKCFEVSPCGTVGLFERVVPITSREEFQIIADDIFDLINNLIGKYVLEDIGEKFYMNYGLREGFGPVLLDYPYVFELDGRKLRCNVPEPLEPKGYCGGEIDYDLGYNNLICTKCGKRYLATELKSDDIKSGKAKIIIEGEDSIMKCVLKRGDEIVSRLNSDDPISTNTIKSKKDFVKLKAQLSQKPEEKEKPYKPAIKTSDDVQLRATLRGPRRNKDIDGEARAKEEELKKNSETIEVPLAEIKSPEESEVVTSGFVAVIDEPIEEKPTTEKVMNRYILDIDESIEMDEFVIKDSKQILEDYHLLKQTLKDIQKEHDKLKSDYEEAVNNAVTIDEDGNIWNGKGNHIGYIKERYDNIYDELDKLRFELDKINHDYKVLDNEFDIAKTNNTLLEDKYAKLKYIEDHIKLSENDEETFMMIRIHNGEILGCSYSYDNPEVIKEENTSHDENFASVIINDDGDIYDYDNNLIGHTRSKCNKMITKEIDALTCEPNTYDNVKVHETNEEESVVYSDPESSGTTIGDLINKEAFKANDNYKTTDIVAPIENHFSAVVTKEEIIVEDVKEETLVEKVQEEVREIPELIIHPREEDEDESYSEEDEDYDESEDEETEEETENNIDLY